MNCIKKYDMYLFACLIMLCVTQSSYTGQNYHGIVQRNKNNTQTGIFWTQYAQNKWDAIKKDTQEHYARIGNAHLQAGQLRDTGTDKSKKQ